MPLQHSPPKGYAKWNARSQKTARSKARKAFELAGESVPAWCARRAGDPWNVAPSPSKALVPAKPPQEAPTPLPTPPVAPTPPPPPIAPTEAPTLLGPLLAAIRSTFNWSLAGVLLAGAVLGLALIEVGSWLYLLPGDWHGYSYGVGMAGAIVCAALLVGHHAFARLRAGLRDVWCYSLFVLLIGFGVLDMGVAQLRGAAAIHAGVDAALKVVRPAAVCPVETMPDAYITHPKSIEQWQAGATARHKACLDAGAAQQTKETGALVANAKDRDWWERPVLTFAAFLLTVAVGACSAVFHELAHAFLSIFAALGTIVAAPFRRTKPEPAPAPAPTAAPAPAAAREGWIRRGAYWPIRWFARRRQTVQSAG